MRRFWLFSALIGAALLMLTLTAGAQSAATCYIGESAVTITADGDGNLSLPATPLVSGTFVGWVLEKDGAETLYPGGHLYPAAEGETLVFRALSVDLRTLSGAAVSLDEEALRFDGTLALGDLTRLSALAATLSYGVLTAPADSVMGAGRSFTRETAGVSDHPAAAFDAQNDRQGVFSAYVSVPAAAFTRRFAARAYLTVTFAGGQTQTFYAPFTVSAHVRSFHAVCAMALEDRKENATARYPVETATAAGTRYSPYSAAALSILAARLDRVVSVDDVIENGTLTGGIVKHEFTVDAVNFYTFRYYVSPWQVSGLEKDAEAGTATFVITGKNGADHHDIACYYIGGSYRTPTGTECAADGYRITERTTTPST